MTYPGVTSPFKNMNITLKPEVADREFEIGEVWLICDAAPRVAGQELQAVAGLFDR
ncbi:MAG: hypothetical protein ACRC9K_07655 [Afipia sp.]